ncbi:Protein of unknown function [Bryocella elongata]|uniref:DUF4254 domain-containing protein n=1 Tax=Bryocella elongata TaxID=863522 RepID=A0A1H5SGU3_9BACT|nr:DUF4254 domain-containing protein [Bryocella elongata]SEF49839.1 Protein of unknown function [Bryocella elongata]
MLEAQRILTLQDLATAFGHDATLATPVAASAFEQLVLDQHMANFDLWHQEDQARDVAASDHTITVVKHEIDRLNQRRNDLAEQIDLALLAELPAFDLALPLHSETPGLMIDRLSIIELKRFHTAEEVQRPDADEAHHQRNRARLAVLDEQRNDLAGCLDALWKDVNAGKRRFKLYRQLKMYNDPSLNPVLYQKAQK